MLYKPQLGTALTSRGCAVSYLTSYQAVLLLVSSAMGWRHAKDNLKNKAIVKDGHLIKKQHAFSLKDKLDLIRWVESGETLAAIARSKSLNESTVRIMVRNKDTICKAVEEQSPGAASNVVWVPHDPYVVPIEKALYVWMQDCVRRDIPCNMPAVWMTARNFFKKVLEKAGVDPVFI